MNDYGAQVERGVVIEADSEAEKFRVKSTSRDGIVSPMISAIPCDGLSVGDAVFFILFEDGDGLILTKAR